MAQLSNRYWIEVILRVSGHMADNPIELAQKTELVKFHWRAVSFFVNALHYRIKLQDRDQTFLLQSNEEIEVTAVAER